MKNKILKILSIIYLLFSICLLLINFYKFNTYDFIGIIISIILITLILKNKLKFNKKTYIFLITLSILIRIIPFFINHTNIFSDYSFFFNSAKSFALNEPINNSYIGLFPYLYPYIFLLGNFMKIFGTNYNIVILFNLINEIISIIFLYLLLNKIDKKNKKTSIFIYLLNPFNIIWITFCSPVIIVNAFFIISFYIIYILKEKIKNTKQTKNIILISIILGIILSITNTLRPIVIILLIALIMWYIIYSINNKKNLKKYIVPILITSITYILCNLLITNYISTKIAMDIPTKKSGWTIFVGSNYDANGMWNESDANYLYELYNKFDNNKTQNILQEKGIERYKNLGIKSIILLIKKSFILGSNVETYTATEYFNLTNYNISNISKTIINISLSIYWYTILISNILITIKNIKRKKYNLLFPYAIYTFGLFISTLLVEVSPRYFMPVFIPIIIYTTQINNKEIKYEKK